MKKKIQSVNSDEIIDVQAATAIHPAGGVNQRAARDVSLAALMHELQVHQVELEAQNEELKRAQHDLQTLAEKYRDLYDFAPVGYLTLDGNGKILEANLACASLLGMGRSELIRKQFPSFVLPKSKPQYNSLVSKTRETGVNQSHELEIELVNGTNLTVQAEVIAGNTNGDGANQFRVALFDITARKKAEQTVQEHFEVLARKLGFLTGELDLERFLRQSLVVFTEQDHAECAAFWFADLSQDTISLHLVNNGRQVLTASEFSKGFGSSPLPLESLPFWREMRRSRRPLILYDLATYPQFHMKYDDSDTPLERTLLIAPLLLGQDVLGLAVLQSPGRRTYQPEEIAFAQAVAQQITIAVQMARLGEKARQAAVLQERNRMAQEIHDTLAQGFTVILMQLEVVADSLSDAPESARQHLTQARDMARASLAAARRSVRALRPAELEQNSLPGALAEVLTRTAKGTTIQQVLDVHGVALQLHEDTETNLLRIAQEALYNVHKHAKATRIWVELSFEQSDVTLTIKDNGIGFETNTMKDSNHFGLQVMKERAEAVGGSLQVSSKMGTGTQIMATVPSRTPRMWEV